ncbi:MAG: folate-binding protein, partial [Gammaproteobacteria bacterium]
ERALAQLNKYIVFSKAKARLDDTLHGFALLGSDAAGWLRDHNEAGIPEDTGLAWADADGAVIRLQDDALECWVTTGLAEKYQQLAEQEQRLVGTAAWQAWLVAHGIGEVRAETIEVFIPQLINLHLTGGISFTKGCYTGQEIVARMKYRGKLKRHMYRAAIKTDAAIAPNTPVFAGGHAQSVGEVVLAANGELLVSMTKDAKDAGDVHVGAADGPALEFLGLPYDPEAEG